MSAVRPSQCGLLVCKRCLVAGCSSERKNNVVNITGRCNSRTDTPLSSEISESFTRYRPYKFISEPVSIFRERETLTITELK